MAEKREIAPLTGLRFIAALSVALAHGASILAIPGQPESLKHWIGTAAGFGMTLFFVLSGFVIHYNYRDLVTSGTSDGLARFIWARFSRLYPLYILIVALDVRGPAHSLLAGISGAFDEAAFALPYYLTLTQSWLYLTGEKFSLIYLLGNNSPLAWSISTEWFFYMVFPLFAVGVIRLRTAPTILLAIGIVSVVWVSIASYLFDQLPSLNSWAIGHFGSIAGISNGYQDSFFRWLLYFSPYLRLGEFLLGCLIAQLYVVWLNRPASTIETRFGVALLAVALASIPVFTYLMYSPNGWLPLRRLNFNFGLAPSVAITVFCLARYRSRVSRLTSWRPLVTLGEASYSIYLLHFPVFRHLQPFGANTFFAKSGAAYREFLPLLIGRLTLAIAAVLIVALISYRIVEIPARSWLRRLFALDWRLPSRNAALAVLAVSLPAAVLVVRPHLAEVDGNLTKGIRVLTATYGLNCGAPPGNATHRLQRACNGRGDCRYVVSVAVLGDSAPNCGKSFRVEYECAPNPGRLAEEIPGEAGFNSPILLSCNRATTSANVR